MCLTYDKCDCGLNPHLQPLPDNNERHLLLRSECDRVDFQALDNIKQHAKKALTADKLEVHRTGGGQFVRQVTELDEKVIALLGYRAIPLSNPYDADASYHNDSGVLINFYCILSSYGYSQGFLGWAIKIYDSGVIKNVDFLALFGTTSSECEEMRPTLLLPTW